MLHAFGVRVSASVARFWRNISRIAARIGWIQIIVQYCHSEIGVGLWSNLEQTCLDLAVVPSQPLPSLFVLI